MEREKSKQAAGKNGGIFAPVRKFLNEGDYFRATGLANLFFSGKGGCSWLPNNNDAYQVAGDLKFRLKENMNLLPVSLMFLMQWLKRSEEVIKR